MNTEQWLEMVEKNKQKMIEKDLKAKEKGILKGRYLEEPYADGYAYYEIIRENKKSVRIRVIKNIGDDWVLPLFGEEATVDIGYVKGKLRYRDYMDELFARRKEELKGE